MEALNQIELDALLKRALEEDIGHGDITTAATVTPGQQARARILLKEPRAIFCGGFVLARTFALSGALPRINTLASEGAELSRGDLAAEIDGGLSGLLIGERTALNLVQLMSGIATLTRSYVDAVAGTRARIVDTRKTHPGLRALEKYAVRAGGGSNHRFGLDSGVLIKDNHIAAAGSVSEALRRARMRAPHTLRVEIECATLEQLREALESGADAILLDNMSADQMLKARAIAGGNVMLEASGGVTIDSVRGIAAAGVDLISVGALTHSAPAIDLSMKIERR